MTCWRLLGRDSTLLLLCLCLSMAPASAATTTAAAPEAAAAADGPACAARCVWGLGVLYGVSTSRCEAHGWGRDASSLLDVKTLAASLGLAVQLERATSQEVYQRSQPSIVHLQHDAEGHFAIITGTGLTHVQLWDGPGSPIRSMEKRAFEVAFTGYLASVAESPGGAPRLVIAPAVTELGEVPSGRDVECIVEVRNTGERPLHVAVLRTSCGCTAAVLGSDSIEPGKAATLTVRVDPPAGGAFQQSVELSSDAPGKHLAFVLIAGRVRFGNTSALPDRVTLSGAIGQTLWREFSVFAPAAAVVRDVACSLVDVEAILVQRSTHNYLSCHVIRVEVPALALGRSHADLSIEFADESLPALRVPVDTEIQPVWRSTPTRVLESDLLVGQLLRTTVRLDNADTPSAIIADARVSVPGAAVKLTKGPTNGECVLELTVVAAKPGLLQGAIELTGAAGVVTAVIPVTILVVSPQPATAAQLER